MYLKRIMEQFKNNNLIKTATLLPIIDTLYAMGNLFVGITEDSWWFILTGIYYIILSSTRFTVLIINKKQQNNFVPKFTGWMLMSTAIPLLGIALLSSVKDTGSKFHEIIMITIALYAFSKITLAIINSIKSRKNSDSLSKSLRSVSLATAFVSIASLQRSMLVSFGDMSANEIRLFNSMTSIGVSLLVFFIGLLLFRSAQTK